MVEVKRVIKLITHQEVTDKPRDEPDFPMREWSVRIYLLDENHNEIPANIFEKVTYKLHPSFKTATQTFKTPPFEIREEGWGEFELTVLLATIEKGEHTIKHDLNFRKNDYEAEYTLTFKNPKPALMGLLRQSGPIPSEGSTPKQKRGATVKAEEEHNSKKRKRGGQVDMDRLAAGLEKLQEEELLWVVQVVREMKTADTYTKTMLEEGEFHVDLYTLPDNCLRRLWDYTAEKVDL